MADKLNPMQGFRLSGWQRIAIVLSVLWAMVGGSWEWKHANDQADANFRACVAKIETASDLQACRETRFHAIAVPRGYRAAIVAIAPILIVWLSVYALIGLVNWVRRGFQTST